MVEQTAPTRHRPRRWRIVALLVVSVGLALLVNNRVAQVFHIPSASMEPGLRQGDRILVNKRDRDLARGDVVVFADPGGWVERPSSPNSVQRALGAVGLYPSTGHLVKRIIGMPGDVISCCDKQGRILVNGEPMDASGFISSDPDRACDGAMRGCTWQAGPVPEGRLFLMGDNRSSTRDSTRWLCTQEATDCEQGAAFVDQSLVVGTVWGVVWPLSRWRHDERPSAFGTQD